MRYHGLPLGAPFHGDYLVDPVWFFYWLIAAVVLAPIVLIIKGIKAKPPPETPKPKR